MDGLECTRRIRELEREGKLPGHLPIIALTANAGGTFHLNALTNYKPNKIAWKLAQMRLSRSH